MTDITLTLKPEYTGERRTYRISCNVIYEEMGFTQHCRDLQEAAKEVIYFIAHHDITQPKYHIAIAEPGPRAQLERRELSDLLANPLFMKQAQVRVMRERHV